MGGNVSKPSASPKLSASQRLKRNNSPKLALSAQEYDSQEQDAAAAAAEERMRAEWERKRAERERRWIEEDMAHKAAAERKREKDTAERKREEEENERRDAAEEQHRLIEELNARRAAANDKELKKFCMRQERLEQVADSNCPTYLLSTIDESSHTCSSQGSADRETRSKLQAMKPLPTAGKSLPIEPENRQLKEDDDSFAAFTRHVQNAGGRSWEEFAKLSVEDQKVLHAKYCRVLRSPRLTDHSVTLDCLLPEPAAKRKTGPTLEHVLPLIKPEVAELTSGMRVVRLADGKRQPLQPLRPSFKWMLWGYVQQNFGLDLSEDEVQSVADLLKNNETIPSTNSTAFKQLIEIVLSMTRKSNGGKGQLHVEYGRPGSNMLIVHSDAGTRFLDLDDDVAEVLLSWVRMCLRK